MKIINHECYVSLEVAKLLKEAGFDLECRCYYETSGKLRGKNSGNFCNHNSPLIWQNNGNTDTQLYSAPTLEVAQRWLREVKNIDVVVLRAMQWIQFYYTIEHEENRTSKVDFMSLNEDLWWFKYEEAQEAGIKKCLTLILNENEK